MTRFLPSLGLFHHPNRKPNHPTIPSSPLPLPNPHKNQPLSKLFLEEINEKVGPIPPPSPATQHKAYAQLLHAFQDELKREAAAAAHRPESQPPPAIQNGSSPPTNQPQPEPQPVDYATVLKSFNQDWLKGTVESVMVTLGVPLKGEELATAAEATIATMELLALKV